MTSTNSASLRARFVTASCCTITVLALTAAALVLLLGGTSSAEERGAAAIAAQGHGGHGGVAGTTSAAASSQLPEMEPGMNMVGESVRAAGGPHATDAFLNLPPAKPYEPGRVRAFTLRVEEHDIEIADGLDFPAWTYVQPGHAASAPGPTLRVTEGDRVRITLENASTQPHSLHTHGIHPADQDGVLDMVQPGQSFTYEFTAGPSGVQPYHCHAVPLLKHIGKGMYGMLIIDPKVPPAVKADREMSMVMNAFDTNYDGVNEVYAVNGLAFHYAKYPIQVKRGELNRIYLENMTEHDPINSFHVHGNFFEYRPIGFQNPPQQTDIVSQIQGDRGIIDIRFPTTGLYMFHAHQTEFGDLGWMGFFEVTA